MALKAYTHGHDEFVKFVRQVAREAFVAPNITDPDFRIKLGAELVWNMLEDEILLAKRLDPALKRKAESLTGLVPFKLAVANVVEELKQKGV